MPSRRSLLLGAGALLGAGCARTPPPAPPRPRGLDDFAADYEALMAEHGLAEWSRYAGEKPAGDEAKAMADLRGRERDAVFAVAEAALAEAARLDPREVDLWQRARRGLALLGDARASELADRLEQTLNEASPVVDGKKVARGELRKMARSDDADARRAAQRAFEPVQREAAPIARDLLRRRRALAAELRLDGGFYGALLELRGLSFDRLRSLLGQLDELTRPAYIDALVEARKSASAPSASIFDIEWLIRHLGDAPDERFPADQALPFARAVWGQLGFDLSRVRIDVREFAFSGQTISIRVPDDIRAVVSPTPGARFYGTLMHELGHAFAASKNAEARPVFKGYEWVPGLSEPAFDEGFAEIFGRLLDEPPVLARHLPALTADERARFARVRARAELFSIRSRLVSIAFERAALDDPEQDLDALWFSLQRDLSGLDVPRDAVATWATSPFLATYPVYTQSYLLAAMVSCQTRAALRRSLGPDWVSPRAASALVSAFAADGARSRLDDKLRRVSGAPLAVDDYAAWLSGK